MRGVSPARRAATALAILGTLALAGCGGSKQVIAVTLTDFSINPTTITARAGAVTFKVHNGGNTEHNFVIEDGSQKVVAELPVLGVGKTQEVRVSAQPGDYVLVCTLPGHKDAGMTGQLTVK